MFTLLSLIQIEVAGSLFCKHVFKFLFLIELDKVMTLGGHGRKLFKPQESSPRGKAAHRTLTLREERTDGLNGASSFTAGLVGGGWSVRLSSAGLLAVGTGLNMDARLRFAFCRTYEFSPSLSLHSGCR